MMNSQVPKIIPVLAGVFSLGVKAGKIIYERPSFPVVHTRETETRVIHENGVIETSKSKELWSSTPYDAFNATVTRSKELFFDPFGNSLSPHLLQLEVKLILASILIPLVLYGIHKYFLKK